MKKMMGILLSAVLLFTGCAGGGGRGAAQTVQAYCVQTALPLADALVHLAESDDYTGFIVPEGFDNVLDELRGLPAAPDGALLIGIPDAVLEQGIAALGVDFEGDELLRQYGIQRVFLALPYSGAAQRGSLDILVANILNISASGQGHEQLTEKTLLILSYGEAAMVWVCFLPMEDGSVLIGATLTRAVYRQDLFDGSLLEQLEPALPLDALRVEELDGQTLAQWLA